MKRSVVEVDRAAHTLDLLDDDAAVLVGPIPASVDKLIAADLQATDALALELLVDLGLRGDTSVVGAEHPARGLAAHAGHADDSVLDGVVGGVTHVELAGYIGRRNGDGAVAHALAALIVAAVEPTSVGSPARWSTDRSSWASLPYISPCPIGVSACLVFARSGPGSHEEHI